MSIDVKLKDGDGSGKEAHVHGFSTAARTDHSGLLVLTRPFQDFSPEFHPFLNDDFGTAMNQNIAFTGTPRGIHNGVDNLYWTGVAGAGTWDFEDTTDPFAGSNCVSLTSGNNNDIATFTAGVGSEVDIGVFTAVTGQVRLETYNGVTNSIILQFLSSDVDVGVSVNLNDFIDIGLLDAYQGFVIPKANFDLTTQTVHQLETLVERSGGAKPTFRLDDVQVEQTGTPAVFKATTPLGTRFHITEIRIRMEDVFDSTLANATMPDLDPDALLGVSALSNGIVFSRVKKGKTLFSVNLKDLGDFLATGSDLINVTGNATNTGLTLLVKFPEPIVLDGGEEENFLSFTISDNISGLTRFTAAARGALEI